MQLPFSGGLLIARFCLDAEHLISGTQMRRLNCDRLNQCKLCQLLRL